MAHRLILVDSALAVASGTGRASRSLTAAFNPELRNRSCIELQFFYSQNELRHERQIARRCRLVKHQTPYKASSESRDDAGGSRFCGPDLSVPAPNPDTRFPPSDDAESSSPPQSEARPWHRRRPARRRGISAATDRRRSRAPRQAAPGGAPVSPRSASLKLARLRRQQTQHHRD